MPLRQHSKWRVAGTIGVAGVSAAGLFGCQAASANPREPSAFELVAGAPQSSILYRPCDDCVIASKPDGAHIGGVEIDAGSITDRSGHPVGHYSLQATGITPFTSSAKGEISELATIVIGHDQLISQSLEEPPDDGGVAAIIGGTGRFAGAKGQIRYTDQPDGTTLLRITLGSK